MGVREKRQFARNKPPKAWLETTALRERCNVVAEEGLLAYPNNAIRRDPFHLQYRENIENNITKILFVLLGKGIDVNAMATLNKVRLSWCF